MGIGISFGGSYQKKARNNKGRSIIDLPDDYIVLDLETTGLEPEFDEIIEIGAIKIRNNEEIGSFNSLIKPKTEIDEFIVKLTGITNDMVKDSPYIEDVIGNLVDFIGDSLVIGHNVNFDINFIYDAIETVLEKPFSNNFVDLLRISRKLSPDFENHKLKTLAENWQVDYSQAHRAMKDCYITDELYKKYKDLVYEKYTDKETFVNLFKRENSKSHKNFDLRELVSENGDDTSNYKDDFIGKIFVFTGALEKMLRKDAAQIVVNLGGKCENGVTKNTNYLVLGTYDYADRIKNGKSKKLLKAEELILSGYDLTIMSETTFYEMISVDLVRYENNRDATSNKGNEDEIRSRNITTSQVATTDIFLEEEIKVFLKVKEILTDAQKDITALRCSRLSSGEFDISIFGSLLRIKLKTRKPYILIDKNAEDVEFTKFNVIPAGSKEYGKVRLAYQSVEEINKLKNYILTYYNIINEGNESYINNVGCGLKNYLNYLQSENFYK